MSPRLLLRCDPLHRHASTIRESIKFWSATMLTLKVLKDTLNTPLHVTPTVPYSDRVMTDEIFPSHTHTLYCSDVLLSREDEAV